MDGHTSPPNSNWDSNSESDYEGLMEDESQLSEAYDDENLHADPKWTAYLLEDIEKDEKPRMHITERIKLIEAEEKRRYEEAYSRGLPTIPDDFVPVVVKKPTKEEQEAKYKAWREKLARIKREKEAVMAEDRKCARREYEKYAKIQKDNRTRDYYWKPDPLYSLHLRDLGYSKIATDKALFHVDNKSVQHALRYLKENPNPTELTKEEVMAVGEEVLKQIRPKRPPNCEPFKENLQADDEMEIEQASQTIGGNLEEECDVPSGLPSSGSSVEEKKSVEEVETAEGSKKRGLKRNHSGEEIKIIENPISDEKMIEPIVGENLLQYRMIFVSNTGLLMDAITLSLEVSKVTVKMMDKLMNGGNELNKMQDEWIKEGCTMHMFKGVNNSHLYNLQKDVENHGYINYLAECSHYRSVNTPSPTVLAVFGETNHMKRVINILEKL